MRKMKRWVSLLLVLVMSLGLIQVPAMAAAGDVAYEGWHNGTIQALARDAEDGTKRIPGVMFQLEDITAGRYTNLGTFETDHTWSQLSAGTYRLTQVSTPNTYVENVQAKIIVLNPTTPSVRETFYSHVRGSILISRISSADGSPVAGGTYVVKNSQTNTVVFRGTTGADGTVLVPSLPNGTYIVEEESPAPGHSLLTGSQHVTVRGDSRPTAITFSDAPWATVTIYITDEVTGKPLANAHVKVDTVGGNQIDAGVTNAAGVWVSKALEPGSYVASQVDPAVKGYNAYYPSAGFEIKTDGAGVVLNWYNVPLGSWTCIAYDSITGQPLPGATVTLRDDKNQIVNIPGVTNPVTTGPSGEAIFNNLPDGHYTATITPPPGHIMDTTSVNVNITGGSNEFINLTGTEKGSILVRCTDPSGKGLAGAEFRVSRMNGDYIGNITTGADGTGTLGNLESGQYLIEQTIAPAGYVKVTQTMTVNVSAGKIAEVTFINRDKPFITVETMVKGTRSPIEGSTVTLVNSAGQEIRRGYTDSNGQVTFENLEPGTYTAKYTACPDGYTIEVASQTVVVEVSESGYACLTATKHSAILVEKRDSQTGEPLAGAVFQVRNSQGVPVGLITTDIAGCATTEVLQPGEYTIREMFAPEKYVPTTELREVTVTNNEVRHEVFTNTKFSGIVVYAYDKLGNPLANVPYIVYQVNKQGVTTEVAHITTNNSGIATTQELAPGQYMVTETTIPENYTLVNPTESHIELFAGEAQYVRFVHVLKSSILIQTLDRKTGDKIPGAVYQITNNDSSFTANYTADQNGEVQTELLEQGTYYVKQIKAPEGYLLNTTTQTIQVLRDQVNQARFDNDAISRIEIQSVIAGSNFGLEECSYTVEDANGKEVFHATTDATGLLYTGELAPGKYTVKEIACKDGYEIVQSSRTVQVTTGIPTSVKFEHIAYTSIIISLTDFEDSTKGLENAKFIIETLGGEYVTDVVTDKAGRAETEILPAGTYIIRQETAPEGYLLETMYQWINLTSNSCARLEFTNKHVSGLIIESFMLNSHTPVAGTQFEISHENGKVVKTVTADATGIIQVTDLEPDVYVIKEVSTPNGYTATTLTQKVTVTFGASTTATFYHTGKSALVIRLTDAIDATPLAGGLFRVTNSRGDVILNDAMTDKDGQITVPIMEAGKYTVNQIKAPEGYSIDTNPVTVEVRDEQTAYANVTNHRNQGLTIEVIDTEGNHLDGAKFDIYNDKNIIVKTVSVDHTGIAFIENLKAGVYTVKETTVPFGWTSRTLSQTVTIGQEGNGTLKFVHSSKSALVITLIDAQDKTPIAGGQFELRDSKGSVVVGNLVTDSSGVITVPTLNAGRYTLVQVKTAEGYSIDKTVYTVDIRDDQVCEITVTNHKNKGLTIEVLDDANNHLGGAQFEIRDTNNTLVGSYTVDATGVLFVENLTAGKYVIKEIKTPTGWTARTLTQDVTISVNADTSVKFYHTQKSSLVINLTDALNGNAIKGGIFKITDSKGNEVQSNLMTDEAGKITVPSMEAGKYTITQTKTIDGYVIDQPVVSVTIQDNQTAVVNVTNHRMTNLVINVLDESDNFLSGGTFEIRDAQTNVVIGTYQNDATGVINVDSVAPGKYIIKEVSGPDGWTIKTNSQEVTVVATKSATVKFYHTQKSNLTVNLKDATSGKLLAGAVYRITAANGDFVGEYTTGSNGQFVVGSLTAGTYTVTMTKAPEGYEIDNTPHQVVVKDNKTIVLDLTLKFISNFRLVNTVKQTGAPLGGVTYKITKYDGTLVGNYTTDDAGLINIELQAGTYTVYQTSVPNGVVKNEKVFDVVIKAGQNFVLEVQNEIESRITVKFVDAVSGNPIMGVKIEIKEKATLNYLGQFTSDDLGEIILTDVLSAGKYQITMISCPDSYDKDTTPKTVEVKTGETTEIIWKLSGHVGQIQINTWAGESSAMMQVAQNTKIPGAVYQIKNVQGVVVATVTGDANGVAYSGALPLGTYTVQMIQAPAGWQLNSAIGNVIITNSSDNKEINVYLKNVKYNMSVRVTGQMSLWAGQTGKYAFVECGNGANVPMASFSLVAKIPTDCMRGIAFYTGVWNGPAAYGTVEYKTNQNTWRTLAQGVNSKSNISFDLSTQSLGLNTNEYVTDVRITFQNVIAGFKASMAPTLYTQVLTGIRTGYQATVRAEVMGQLAYAGVMNGNENLAGGSWCAGQSQFTSYIYGVANPVYPNRLPTTGY